MCAYLVCLWVIKSQDDVVGLAVGIRHQQAVDDGPSGQDVYLHAVLVPQHNCSVGVCVCLQRSALDGLALILGSE